mmetsp:Transcript_33381/g.37974  ORF Transcript_33381/g.37974 Transcript_33381/m.37974 type:complete len:428 (-) Transcript_33381:253-1536(-)|eukprot:CAMPEP_0194133336 /NCGR_PEP_ID=MMETSP0152-20130528/3551_1 /TAXON_ID=1049557 /ORGANISM="Thalassiothrix antarctica, Strain L6-D1" /LENGTH=427 /DNA_ID=CAMNT_0038828633 /DNA_START=125 /DNA_END=1408 /DNA_ORIENTATION=-
MKLSLAILYSTSLAPVSAFQMSSSPFRRSVFSVSGIRMSNDDNSIEAPTTYRVEEIEGQQLKELKDPMNLYSANSEERKEGRIQSNREPDIDSDKTIFDPMNLYSENSEERKEDRILSNGEPDTSDRQLTDPMNLYSANSEERKDGRIRSIEDPDIDSDKPLQDPMNLYSANSDERKDGRIQSNSNANGESDNISEKPIYDPLGIYPSDSGEQLKGQIKASEPELKVVSAVVDPMNIYSSKDGIDDAVMSEALPFLTRPLILDGSMVGDAGFDPLGFARTQEDLTNYREAEIKHARLAMLAAAGWPLSELFDKKIALALHMSPLVDAADRAPSILNGGLEKVNPFYWMLCLVSAAAIDVYGISKSKSGDASYFPGNLGFDPLGLYPKEAEGQMRMQLAEIKNGRLAMISILAFAVQEFVSKSGVIHL